MAVQGLLRPTPDLEAGVPGLHQEVVDPVDQPEENLVAGRAGDGQVKFTVGLGPRLPPGHQLAVALDNGPQLFLFVLRRPLGGQTRQVRLDEPAGLQYLLEVVPLLQDAQRQGLDQVLDAGRRDVRPAPHPAFHQAQGFQDTDGLSHRGPAHVKSLDEVSFGRKAVAALQLPLRNQTLNLGDDGLIHPVFLDLLKLQATSLFSFCISRFQGWPGFSGIAKLA